MIVKLVTTQGAVYPTMDAPEDDPAVSRLIGDAILQVGGNLDHIELIRGDEVVREVRITDK